MLALISDSRRTPSNALNPHQPSNGFGGGFLPYKGKGYNAREISDAVIPARKSTCAARRNSTPARPTSSLTENKHFRA